jgi:hypothetical protein
LRACSAAAERNSSAAACGDRPSIDRLRAERAASASCRPRRRRRRSDHDIDHDISSDIDRDIGR